VAAGYWDQPELSAAVFGAGPALGGKKYLRTGDLGFISDGELYVTGRIKDLIIIRGRNHYPQDIEATAEKAHPLVRPGAVVAFSMETSGMEVLVVLLETKSGQEKDGEEIIQAVRRSVSVEHQLVPQAVVLLAPRTLPKTSSGKLQRRKCRRSFENNQLAAVRIWTRGSGD
jgi:acyl-CoA synthetase (AMP-forming)/AMP-acid ligase II